MIKLPIIQKINNNLITLKEKTITEVNNLLNNEIIENIINNFIDDKEI